VIVQIVKTLVRGCASFRAADALRGRPDAWAPQRADDLPGVEVSYHAQRAEQHRAEERYRAEDQGLDVAGHAATEGLVLAPRATLSARHSGWLRRDSRPSHQPRASISRLTS
jgi:hypothetical protein